MREVKPSQERIMIKLLPFKNLFFGQYDIFVKTRSRMSKAIAFSRQNDAA